VDTVSFRFFISDDKIQKLDRLVQEMLSRDKKGEYPEATFPGAGVSGGQDYVDADSSAGSKDDDS
jgi:hypothetical protein